jgi:hypothetical protein
VSCEAARTALQVWQQASIDLLAAARAELDDREFETWLSTLAKRVAHAQLALDLDAWGGDL